MFCGSLRHREQESFIIDQSYHCSVIAIFLDDSSVVSVSTLLRELSFSSCITSHMLLSQFCPCKTLHLLGLFMLRTLVLSCIFLVVALFIFH